MAGKDYAKIAASKIRTPSESNRRPRILVYGRNKKGKTRFCTTAPNVLIMDPEGGTDEEKKSNPDVWPIDSWDDINEVYQFLRSGGKSPRSGQPYQWVALDGLTKITNIALRWVMSQEEERNLERKPNQVGKQDYGKSGEMVKGMLHNFHSLRHLGVLITAQERMIEIEELGEEDEEAESVSAMFVPDLPKGARSSVNQVVDIIGRIYVVRGSFKKKYRDKATGKVITKEIDGLQRRLWIGPHASYDTGYRSDFILPDYIQDPSVPRVITAMREGKA
jgi:ribosomal protein L35AE/L33A